jgi:hypothetical protein
MNILVTGFMINGQRLTRLGGGGVVVGMLRLVAFKLGTKLEAKFQGLFDMCTSVRAYMLDILHTPVASLKLTQTMIYFSVTILWTVMYLRLFAQRKNRK